MHHDASYLTFENDAVPSFQQQFPIPYSHRDHILSCVQEWMRQGLIERSPGSNWNSSIFCVKKKVVLGGEGDGERALRCVLDLRGLNEQCKPLSYRLPLIQESLQAIGRSGCSLWSQIDLRSSFYNVVLDPASRHLTAFHIPHVGSFHWLRSPFGCQSSPGHFSRLMMHVMQCLEFVQCYVDDILVSSHTHVEMVDRLAQTFARLRKHQLKVNLPKSKLGSTEVTWLGYKLSPEGYTPTLDKVQAVRDAPPPDTVKKIRQFVGFATT